MTMLSRRIVRFGAILAAAGAMAASATALANDAFVATVTVDGLESPDAGVRDAATQQAEGEGLGAVLRRLTAERDHGRLPPTEGPNVAGYIQDVTILGEGGRLQVTMRADAVRQLLTGLGITFVETPAPLLVVVPVYQGPGGPVLWSGANPWLDAWQVYDGATGLAPLVVPYGEFGDLDALNAQEALDGNPAALQALALRYDAAGSLVAVYEPQGNQAVIRLTIRADDGWQQTTSVTVAQTDPVAAAGLDATVAAVERLWVESQNRPSYDGPVSTIEATAVFSSLNDWIAIRHALDQAAIVQHYVIPVLGGQNARVVLTHYADFRTLQQDLAGAGLMLEQGGYAANGLPGLTLRLAAGAQSVSQGGTQPPASYNDNIGAPISPNAPAWDNSSQAQSSTIAPRIPTLRFNP